MCEMPSTAQGWLSDEVFRQVVAHTPLVSLDFVVTNHQEEWMMGRRVNRPAQGSWYVPGGRVRMNETLEAAAQKLTRDELSQAGELSRMRFLGVYQHFYAERMLDHEPSTHYVVLAYQLMLDLGLETLPRQQYGCYRWWSPYTIAQNETVHANTRAYLTAVPS